MPYAIRLTPTARRRITRYPLFHERLVRCIDGLADNPRPDACKKLRVARDNCYRIRIGDLRVVYQVDDGQAVVLVLVIAHRRDVYSAMRRLLRG